MLKIYFFLFFSVGFDQNSHLRTKNFKMINTSRISNKQSKTLVLEDQSTLITKIIHVSVIIDEGIIHLMQILTDILSNLKLITIKCYDFSRDVYIEINTNDCFVPVSFMINNPSSIILLKINRLQEQRSIVSASSLFSLESDIKSQNSSMKKQRSKERVIFEVIQIVKKWRQLHYSKNDCKKKSLQEAAQMVGLPKKSLDDYYYQLRLGEKYDFDFKAHLFDRIGVLRNYLKNIKQSPLYDRNEKHPKKLKILDDFQNLSQNYRNQHISLMKQQVQQAKQVQQIQFFQDEQLNPPRDININNNQLYQQPMSQQQNNHVYNSFFNEFQYLLNYKDPFLEVDFNFKKKNNGQDDYFQF